MTKCKFESCIKAVFSHGYCEEHQVQRTDDKYLQGLPKEKFSVNEYKAKRLKNGR